MNLGRHSFPLSSRASSIRTRIETKLVADNGCKPLHFYSIFHNNKDWNPSSSTHSQCSVSSKASSTTTRIVRRESDCLSAKAVPQRAAVSRTIREHLPSEQGLPRRNHIKSGISLPYLPGIVTLRSQWREGRTKHSLIIDNWTLIIVSSSIRTRIETSYTVLSSKCRHLPEHLPPQQGLKHRAPELKLCSRSTSRASSTTTRIET